MARPTVPNTIRQRVPQPFLLCLLQGEIIHYAALGSYDFTNSGSLKTFNNNLKVIFFALFMPFILLSFKNTFTYPFGHENFRAFVQMNEQLYQFFKLKYICIDKLTTGKLSYLYYMINTCMCFRFSKNPNLKKVTFD